MKSSDFITESKHSNAVKTEAVNKEHALYKEYMNLKKMPISDLRSIIQRQQKIVDVTEYTTKDHAASAILRHRHGDKRVDAVFGGHVDEQGVAEGRPSQRHPLEDHEYHKKSDAELIYIAKDARAAAEAAKSMNNTTAENKYLDQANDSATVRHFRKTSGMPDWYKKKYGHMNEELEDDSDITTKDNPRSGKKQSVDRIIKDNITADQTEQEYKQDTILDYITSAVDNFEAINLDDPREVYDSVINYLDYDMSGVDTSEITMRDVKKALDIYKTRTGIYSESKMKPAKKQSVDRIIKDNITADQISKDREGNYIFRRGYYYRPSKMSPGDWAQNISKRLQEVGINNTIVDTGDIWKPFKGGASLKAQSHYYVKIKVDNEQSVAEGWFFKSPEEKMKKAEQQAADAKKAADADAKATADLEQQFEKDRKEWRNRMINPYKRLSNLIDQSDWQKVARTATVIDNLANYGISRGYISFSSVEEKNSFLNKLHNLMKKITVTFGNIDRKDFAGGGTGAAIGLALGGLPGAVIGGALGSMRKSSKLTAQELAIANARAQKEDSKKYFIKKLENFQPKFIETMDLVKNKPIKLRPGRGGRPVAGNVIEEVDQIDELKMGTLARYATKAGKSGLSADIEAARKRDMGDSEGAAASRRKSEKRYAGHYQAINKINNRMKSGVSVAEEAKTPNIGDRVRHISGLTGKLKRVEKRHGTVYTDIELDKDKNIQGTRHKKGEMLFTNLNDIRPIKEEAIISGKKPARKKAPAQTSDYARRREQEKKKGVAEGADLDAQAMDIATKLTTGKNLEKLRGMAYDSTVYRALDRYFAKHNIPETIYNRVANIIFKKINQQGVAEGLNEFTPDGFNGGDDDEGFSPEIAKMAQEDGFTKGAGLADGATLERAITLNNWHSRHGGMYKQYFTKGFKAGRMNKINHDNKQYNLNLKLMKDGSIRHGKQGVAEGDKRPKYVVTTKDKPKKVKPSMGGESPHPYQGSLVGEQQHDPKHIKMAIGIASDPRHKGGDYTGAHNKIEKIAKGLTSHPRVAAVLKKQNEAVKEGLGDLADRGEYDYERKLDRDKDYEDDYKFIPLNKRKKPAAKDDGLEEQQNSSAYQAGFSDGQMGREDPRSSSKYGPGVDDYRRGYADGVKHEQQAKQDRTAKYKSAIAPYLKMSDQELAAAEQQARDRREEIVRAFNKKQGSAEMQKEYAALNNVLQNIHQAKYQRGLGEGKLGKAAGAAAVVAAMMAGEKFTSAENSELGQTLKAAAEAGDTRAAEHLKNLDMYFDTKQTALLTKLSNKYLHGVSESSKKKDACYNKVKSRYKVWPSAYASGALVKCRKVGADNWGNKSK